MHIAVKPDDRFAMFQPSDSKLPRMIIPIGQIPNFYKDPASYHTKLVRARLVSWREASYMPMGKYEGMVGEVGEIASETEALLRQYHVDWSDFSKEIMNSLPQGQYQIPESEIAKRRDLRGIRLFTIDPPTAKDLDDALHIKHLPNGHFEVGVHIADVSFFVRPGTPLDQEAQERSTTVYLIQKAIPMLPHVLCENLCSLNPSVDRLAFSVVWTLTSAGYVSCIFF